MKNLLLGIILLATPCIRAMEGAVLEAEAFLPLERPKDAVLWVDALVESPGHLLKDAIAECFNALTEEYLPLYDTIRDSTVEDKAALLNQERVARLDQARRKLIVAWAQKLLMVQKPEAAEEIQASQDDIAESINLLGQVLTIDDLRIHLVHSAQVACFNDIEHYKAIIQAIDEELQHRTTEDQRWQETNNHFNIAFEAQPKFTRSKAVPELAEAQIVDADETLAKKQALYEQALHHFKASQELDAQKAEQNEVVDQEAVERVDNSLASLNLQTVLLRQAFGLPNSEDHGYRLCVAIQQLATARLRASLEQKRAKAQEKLRELTELHVIFEQNHEELLKIKQDSVLLRARLRRLGKFELTEKDQALLVAFDPKPSGCIVS